jgi:16S rRNA (guanine527-N7)-methyltransferase
MSQTPEQRLRAGIAQLGLSLDEAVIGKLLAYLAGLQKWNQAYNLTAVRDADQMVIKHLLDSLSIQPFVPGGSLIDVGTGAGLPGMILAIVNPGLAVTLLDSNGKKTRFLKQMAAELDLPRVSVAQARVEEQAGQYDIVTSRAFASLADMVNWSAHLLAPGGCFLAMKGQRPDAEIAALPAGYSATAATRLTVPFLDEERHLVRIERIQGTSE